MNQGKSTTVSDSAALPALFPPLTAATLGTILLGGILADATWEIWARFITPLWVGGPLQPAALVQSVFGFRNLALAELIHLVVGVVFYPIGYLYIARPIADRFLPFLSWPVVALGYGVGLWTFALYVMAHLIAGFPAFLGFIQLTWASLVGHLLFALVLGAVVHWRMPASR
ncbi:hypothetical protein [Stappia indica]|uniref:hypothetical protein n=1 Tax=Stappia indica TaxID=538381 RepID=UPI001CD33D77|nr:hypothetical protein [Stappia indica]MCA1299145.1 hypothetical protein [Stappia indica]